MENLNAEQIRYKMSEKQIKTALECLSKPNSSPADREKCYFMWKEPSCFSCYHEVAQNALALIESQEQKIFELENRLKECENGYEGTLHLESCKLHDAEEKVKELTEENDKLHASCTELARVQEENERLERICESYTLQYGTAADKEVFLKKERADTVRKMLSEIKERCIKGGIYPAFVASTIDQIAKEMLEEMHDE